MKIVKCEITKDIYESLYSISLLKNSSIEKVASEVITLYSNRYKNLQESVERSVKNALISGGE